MSDFFANVAARARDSKDAVRPRLPSLFETFDSAGAAPLDVPRELTLEVDARDAAPSRASVPKHSADEAASPPAPGAAGASPAAVPPVAPAPIAAWPLAPAVLDVAPPVAAAIGVPARATAPVPASPPSAAPPVPRADERRVAPRVDAPVEHVVEPRVRRDPAGRAPAADVAPRRDAARDRATGEFERAPARSDVRSTPELMPVAARVAREPSAAAILPRVVRAASQRTLPAALPAAETTIHVSIGRIEVRATQQPAQRRRDAAPSAVMSLGEYLSSHAERAR